MTVYRSSEQNAVLNKNMHHLRDNSEKKSVERPEVPRRTKPRNPRNHSTAEHIMLMRFPNLSRYDKDNKRIKNEEEDEMDQVNTSIRLQKAGKWVSQDIIDEEEARVKKRQNRSDLAQIKGHNKSRTQHTSPIMINLRAQKIFKPCNPGAAKKLLERNIFLNNTQDVNIDIADEDHKDSKFGDSKHGNARFVPNSRSPNQLNKTTCFINSTNGFETFLKRQDEIPRLSILENYRQISKIMRNSFLKAKDIEQRFKNNALSNEELKKKREEEENTMKLTKILKQMNSPRNAFATSEKT
jgi:hypothetical protein